MYLVKNPFWLQYLFPKMLWRKNEVENSIYLTFDDGPIPEITPWVLDCLKDYNAYATFFMVGDNLRKHPTVYDKVISCGHSVGNHTFNHLNGWKTSLPTYLENIDRCKAMLPTSLFRPPYGRMTPSQVKKIARNYQIVMWDVLSGDFDKNITPEKCYQNVVKNITPGSIVVFHDSLKAAENMKFALPRVLEKLSFERWQFKALANCK